MEPAAARPSGPETELRAPPPPAGAPPPRTPKRRVRNYLLDTSLQLRLASYLVGVATALSIGLGWLLWQAYRETSRVIALGDPDGGDSIAQALAREDRWRIVVVALALGAVLACLLGAAVVVTHRIAGPAFVIGRTCRDVAEGKLARPRSLRARDLLVDLADDVAGMVDALRDREEREREALLAAAAVLGDASSPAGERGAAAARLERLAAEKKARLEA